MLDNFEIDFQLTPADEKIIENLRPTSGYLSTLARGTEGRDLVDAITVFHLLKYRTENYTLNYRRSSEMVPKEIVRSIHNVDKLLQPNEQLFHEKYDLMARVVSFALGAFLLRQYQQSEQLQPENDEFAVKVFALTQAFIKKAHATAERQDGTLDDADYKKLRKKFDKYILNLVNLLPIKAGLAQKHKALIKAEQYVNWELQRPTYKTVFIIDGIQVMQSTMPIEYLSAAQAREVSVINEPSENKPFWYTRLAPWEQHYLQDKVQNYPATLSNAKSAVERTLPGNSNLVVNQLVASDGLVLLTYSHTVPSPVGVRSKKLAEHDNTPEVVERKRLALQNLEQALGPAGIYCSEDTIVVSKSLKKEFLGHWGIKKADIPAGMVLTLPVIERGLLTPLTHSALSFVDRFNYAGNNSDMLLEKHTAIAEIKTKIANSPKSSIVPAIYQPNYPVNGIRGVVADVARDQTAAEATKFLHNVFGLLKQVATIKFPGNAEPFGKLATLEISFTYENDNARPITHYSQASINQIIEEINGVDLSQLFHKDDSKQKQNLLKAALKAYIELQHSTIHNNYNKQLFLASLESMINCIIGGVDIMHCKSAKDRRALVTMHTLAMMTYFAKNKQLPSYAEAEDNKRKDFVNIFAKIYCAWHEAEQAGFNSRGSAGIKEETMSLQDTLPKDMQEAIGRLFNVSQRTANLNKPKLKQPKPWMLIGIATVLLTTLAVISMVVLAPVVGPSVVIAIGAVLGSLLGIAAGYLTPGPIWAKGLVGSLVGLLVFTPFLAPIAPAIFASLGISGAFAAKILAVSSAITVGLQSTLAPVYMGLLTAVAAFSAGLARWYDTKRTLFAKGDFAKSKAKPDLLAHEQRERLFDGSQLDDRSSAKLTETKSTQTGLLGWMPDFFKTKTTQAPSLLSSNPTPSNSNNRSTSDNDS